jgi:hypothetical protein
MSDTERVSFLNGNLPLVPPSEAEKPNGDVELDMNERDAGGTSHLCILTDAYFVQIGFRAKVCESTTMQ